jgi:hypothetical protein
MVKRVVTAVGLSLCVALPARALEPDVNLSGTLAMSLSYLENSDNGQDFTDVDLENNGSNFRITAAAQEVGIRAFMAYERGAETEQFLIEQVREFYGGVSGTYGTVLYGRKATDYRLAGERLDPFYNTSVVGVGGTFAAEGASYGLSNLTNGYTSNTVSVRTPAFYGFSGNVAAYLSDNNSNQGTGDKADYAAGIGYANSEWLGLDVGIQALDVNGPVVPTAPGESTAVRLHASLGEKLWAVGLSYEVLDVAALPDPSQYGFVSGSYQLLEKLRLAATIGTVENATAEGLGFSLGAFYELMHNLTAYTAVRRVDLSGGLENHATTVAGGLKFVFDVDL